jgi:hypothetical protein
LTHPKMPPVVAPEKPGKESACRHRWGENWEHGITGKDPYRCAQCNNVWNHIVSKQHIKLIRPGCNLGLEPDQDH